MIDLLGIDVYTCFFFIILSHAPIQSFSLLCGK